MDYTPISTRRVLVAFAFTAFIALVPVLYFVLQSGQVEPLTVLADADGGYGGVMLGFWSAVLTASVIAALMATIAAGRRMVRRPSRA